MHFIKTLAVSFFSMLIMACSPSHESIDSLLSSKAKQGIFNGNVLVVQHGKTIYEHSFGYADPGKEIPLTPDYKFGIGSIYKEFPAVAIMQLQESGRLDLDEALSDYLQKLPDWSDEVRIRHLLQYSSGLPKVDWNTYFNSAEGLSYEVVMQELNQISETAFAPGEGYLYSNYNPFLLMQVIESITGQSFQAYTEEHLFENYDLTGLSFVNEYPFSEPKNMAIPFNKDFKADDITYNLPTIYSSTEGMFNWFSKLDHFQIISKESVMELSQEAISGDNIQAPIGRGDWNQGEMVLHLHHGSSGNYEALVRHHKQDGLYIILLTNQKHGNLHDIANDIYDLATGRYSP